MDKLIIHGPAHLSGNVTISVAKNSALPIMAATLLTEEEVFLKNLPQLQDISTMRKLLRQLGALVDVHEESATTRFFTPKVTSLEAQYEIVKTMRASFLVLGPLLARFQYAKVSLPGGCAIGARAIDIHLEGLQQLGASYDLQGGYVTISTPGRLQGAEIALRFPSVGATENIMMAATLAQGRTVIRNAACEPEIEDLGNFLNALGAHVTGAGTAEIVIEGVEKLAVPQVHFTPIPDRIEACTYLIAALMTNSSIEIENVIPEHIEAVLDVLREMGAIFEVESRKIKTHPHLGLRAINIETGPYPLFPTDVQAQILTLALIAQGESSIVEHIFENRFMHVPELRRMGGGIELHGNEARVQGNAKLFGAPVMCTDLRASAALVIGALAAHGASEIQRVYHIDRGYEKIHAKLTALGVHITRTKG